jgi:hypothetical protein
MSRYTTPSFDPNYEITVGWDWPMRTYFAQVKDIRQAEGDEGFMRVWIGTSFDEIQTPEDLSPPIANYGKLPEEITATLRADRAITIG